MSDIECPHCGVEQSDIHNGGDPGPWWSTHCIPDGEVEHECDDCSKSFIVDCDWTPTFSSRKITDED